MILNQEDRIPKIEVRRVDKPPYSINPSKFSRFSSKKIIFERVMSDPSWESYMRMYDEKVPNIIEEEKVGYSRVDFALAHASWIVHDAFEGGVSRAKIKPYRASACTMGIDWTKTKCAANDPRRMSSYVKRAAKLFDVALTGICRLNSDWLYAEVNIPEEFENVIVLAIEMDADGTATSPAAPAAAATGAGYSKMAFALACIGEFIRNLGYQAIQCGNDTALSIPLAIEAGLGELGRNGLLVTPEYGSRVRLCKILTDLPLEPDVPIKFGVKKFCKGCKLCARNCKANAISTSDEPSFEIVCWSNNPGALKWYVNAESCYKFWCENGIDCSTCIKVCPYNIVSTNKTRVTPQKFWEITGK